MEVQDLQCAALEEREVPTQDAEGRRPERIPPLPYASDTEKTAFRCFFFSSSTPNVNLRSVEVPTQVPRRQQNTPPSRKTKLNPGGKRKSQNQANSPITGEVCLDVRSRGHSLNEGLDAGRVRVEEFVNFSAYFSLVVVDLVQDKVGIWRKGVSEGSMRRRMSK